MHLKHIARLYPYFISKFNRESFTNHHQGSRDYDSSKLRRAVEVRDYQAQIEGISHMNCTNQTRRLSTRFVALVDILVGTSMVLPENNCRPSLRLDSQRPCNTGIHHSLCCYCNPDLLDGPSNRISVREMEKPEIMLNIF